MFIKIGNFYLNSLIPTVSIYWMTLKDPEVRKAVKDACLSPDLSNRQQASRSLADIFMGAVRNTPKSERLREDLLRLRRKSQVGKKTGTRREERKWNE